jgi:hypothetical protein
MKSARVIFLLVLLGVVPSVVTAGTSNDKANYVLQSVMNYLEWEKYWFGKFYGEECYRDLVGKNIDVTFYEIDHRSGFAQQMPSSDCDFCKRQSTKADSVTVIIGDTVLQYVVRKGSSFDDKFSISLIPTDTDKHNPCLPTPENLKYRQMIELDKWTSKATQKTVLEAITVIERATEETNSSNRYVIEAVQRTMTNYLQKKCEEKVTGSKKDRPTIKQSRELFLGKFHKNDPYLLVYYPGDDTVYQLNFPSIKMLSQSDTCMEVFRAGIFLGTHGEVKKSEQQTIYRQMLNKLKQNSIRIELP